MRCDVPGLGTTGYIYGMSVYRLIIILVKSENSFNRVVVLQDETCGRRQWMKADLRSKDLETCILVGMV